MEGGGGNEAGLGAAGDDFDSGKKRSDPVIIHAVIELDDNATVVVVISLALLRISKRRMPLFFISSVDKGVAVRFGIVGIGVCVGVVIGVGIDDELVVADPIALGLGNGNIEFPISSVDVGLRLTLGVGSGDIGN